MATLLSVMSRLGFHDRTIESLSSAFFGAPRGTCFAHLPEFKHQSPCKLCSRVSCKSRAECVCALITPGLPEPMLN